jgi:hypothetical protein
MKNHLKSIVLFVSVLLFIGCGSKKFYFENTNVSIKSKIKENHQVIDNKLVKLEGMFCLLSPEDLKNMKDNFSIVFYDEKLVEYNFIISFSKVTCLNDYHFDAKVIDLNNSELHKVEIKNLSNKNINYYIYEKKIENGFIEFGNTSKSEIDLNFLLQKFNEIEIIEKKP